MMWKNIMLLAIMAVAGTGCMVEPLLNPPVGDAKELDSETNRALIGKWKTEFNQAVYTGEAVWVRDDKGKSLEFLQITATATRKNECKKLVPLFGGAFKIDNDMYLVLCADVKKLVDQGQYAEDSMWLLRPNFFVGKLTPDGTNFKLEWINFFEKVKNSAGEEIDAPIADIAKKESNLVVNTTLELQKMLKEKKYKLQPPAALQRQ